ncbi:ParB/RepB/Spo0J family partition protein [Thermogutta sp.]|uniref:ParB/RepB/Spo0J family partition protein n=1 Tax=Thermogutta sp. TaxID=1962930 RepID=UPI003C7E8096
MSREKRLGRGLEALLGRLDSVATGEEHPASVSGEILGQEFSHRDGAAPELREGPSPPKNAPEVMRIPIDDIDRNPFQPRQEIDTEELMQLAESLSTHGLLQPIVVRRHGNRYQLVAGERRLRAARIAGWHEVPARVVQADDRQLAELAIVENLQRKDLNPLEKALCFQRYLEEYGSTQEELAARLNLDRSTISNFIRLLDLPAEVQQALREGRVTQGHARALLGLESEEEQIALCRRIIEEGWSVRRVEAEVQQRQQGGDTPLKIVRPESGHSPASPDEHVALLEQEFRAALGLRVSLTHNGRGRGKLIVHFKNHEEFERLRERICGGEFRQAVGM